jgi:predicted nucleotidyltransferase
MHSDLGLRESDLKIILDLLQSEKAVEQAIVFGSRAKGNYRNGSDVDIALKGKNLDFRIVSHLSYLLNEETPLPYRFDLLNYQTLNNDALKEHIDRVGKEIYSVGKIRILY